MKKIGRIPSNWGFRPLGEIVRPSRPRIKPTDQPGLPFIGLEHIEAQTMRLLGTVPGSSMKSTVVHFMPGDLLYSRLRPYLNKVYRPDFEGLCSSEFIVFPRNESILNQYLQYLLNSRSFVSFASSLNTGDRPRVDFDQISAFKIPLPPLHMQKRIVAEIEKQFSRLDEAVTNLKRVKANLKRYRASVLKAAVEGRLVETEAEIARREGREYETGKQLLERILETRRREWKGKGQYKEPAAPDVRELPELPEGWAWGSLNGIASLKGGITVDSKRNKINARLVPYLRVANVQRGYLDLSEIKHIPVKESDIADLRLEYGDILFNEGGDRDKLGRGWIWESQLVDCIHQNHVFRARLYSADMPPSFVSWWGNTFGKEYFSREGKQSTNLASINLTKLSALPVPIPPLAEQRRIVAEVDRRLSLVRETEAQVEANLKRAERLRQAVLQKAFSGELVRDEAG